MCGTIWHDILPTVMGTEDSPIGSELLRDLDRLDEEVKRLYKDVVVPTWRSDLHGLANTLYGYVMGVFACVDLVSAYRRGRWRGEDGVNPERNILTS